MVRMYLRDAFNKCQSLGISMVQKQRELAELRNEYDVTLDVIREWVMEIRDGDQKDLELSTGLITWRGKRTWIEIDDKNTDVIAKMKRMGLEEFIQFEFIEPVIDEYKLKLPENQEVAKKVMGIDGVSFITKEEVVIDLPDGSVVTVYS